MSIASQVYVESVMQQLLNSIIIMVLIQGLNFFTWLSVVASRKNIDVAGTKNSYRAYFFNF
jgi:hypothetical protein